MIAWMMATTVDVLVFAVLGGLFALGFLAVLFFVVRNGYRALKRIGQAVTLPSLPATDAAEAKPFRSGRVQYNLTGGLVLDKGRLTATGRKHRFTDNIEVGTLGTGNPEGLARWVGTVKGGPVTLEIDPTEVRLRDHDKVESFPRSSLDYVFCQTGQGSGETQGASASLLYVCLHFADKRLGTVAIDAMTFSISLAMLAGEPAGTRYSDAFATAETRAREVAEALGVPYQANYYTGLFAPLMQLFR
jgi:hypothetical protein